MPSGGHARSGIAPDPNALRRERTSDKNGEWVHLPAEGRQGEPPPWPLDRPAQRELQLWADLWVKPQAVQWDTLGLHLMVAAYVRTVIRFEQDDAAVALGSLLRGQETDLGLNVPGLRANRWIIDTPEAAAPARKNGGSRTSADRSRFTRIEGGRAAG